MGANVDSLVYRWYMQGRRRYQLRSIDAVGYALNRLLLWRSDSPHWSVDVHDEGLVVVVFDYDDDSIASVLDSVGGVDVCFEVSDHGNVLCDLDDPFLVGIAADLVRNLAPVPA